MKKKQTLDLKPIGARIRQARDHLRLTQEKAAERTDFSGQYWSLLETGRERGSVNTYLQIAAALDLTLDDLFYDDAAAKRVRKSFSHDELFSDCTADEIVIISEIVLALKTALERVRKL